MAGRFFGDPTQWPLLHQHNSSAQVMAAAGCRISDPNLIFVGQVIYAPDQRVKAALPSVASQASQQAAKRIPRHPDSFPKARTAVRSIPFKYDLKKLPRIAAISPSCQASIRLSGTVTIQSRKACKFAEISRQGFEIQAKNNADLVLGKLVSDSQASWDPTSQEVAFQNGIIIHSGSQQPPVLAKPAGFSSRSRLPAYQVRLQYPTLTGRLDDHQFVAQQLAAEINLTPWPRGAKVKPGPQRRSKTLLAATIVEDICSEGSGSALDPANFAQASAMLRPGLHLSTNVRGVAPLQVALAEPPMASPEKAQRVT